MIKKSLLPTDVIDQWPEVLSDIRIKAIPLYYVDILTITFKNNETWDIKVTAKDVEYLERELTELLDPYEDHIEFIDFQLNIDRIKKDITKKTKKFLKRK